MGFSTSGKGPQADINVTPLVDIVLVLLIIFMVITPMLERGAAVKLPVAENAQNKEDAEDDLLISVDKDGRLFYDQDQVSEEVLRLRLEEDLAVDKRRPLLIKADVLTRFGDVRRVMTLCEEVGAKGVGLMTDKNQIKKAGG